MFGATSALQIVQTLIYLVREVLSYSYWKVGGRVELVAFSPGGGHSFVVTDPMLSVRTSTVKNPGDKCDNDNDDGTDADDNGGTTGTTTGTKSSNRLCGDEVSVTCVSMCSLCGACGVCVEHVEHVWSMWSLCGACGACEHVELVCLGSTWSL
jgi:hypothetical protein